MKKENLPLSEKQINKMRKGKMGSKLRIPFLVFTLLFAMISVSLSVIAFNKNASPLAKIFLYIFLSLTVICFVILIIPTFFPKQWIRCLNNQLFNETFKVEPTNTNFPIDRNYLVDNEIDVSVIDQLNEDAIFSFNNGTTTLLDIRKGLRTKPRTQSNTLDQNEIFNGTVCIFENKSWFFSKRIEIRKENSDLEVSPYIGNNLKCDTKSIEKNCVYYEDEIQKNFLVSNINITKLLDFINNTFSCDYALIFNGDKISILLSNQRLNVHPISYKELKPMDKFISKKISLTNYAKLNDLVINLFERQ